MAVVTTTQVEIAFHQNEGDKGGWCHAAFCVSLLCIVSSFFCVSSHSYPFADIPPISMNSYSTLQSDLHGYVVG